MKKLNRGLRAVLAAAAFAISLPASAHITFENKEVEAGRLVKFVLRIPHGCAGSATTAIRIAIPDALSGVTPEAKPGWTLSAATADATPVHVAAASNGTGGLQAKEIGWTGGRLENSHHDEFIFSATVSARAGTIYVPVVQECEKGVERWIEIPSNGGSSEDLKHPAPSVRVQP
ncbi:YcnI family protein [Mesorhizobium kowhaii]|uniref:YncI copper-binding domain-containing protein n=1 Tax=Mesorhizobium kowhaii TaxID=1300272 RepID=A0A2W7C2N1_9HYPH|nr:YcnI family protein [Mesorhizobium kowhaii]PZV37197.1 hypothetical protein B5V02_17780 [Mesorhizobium kowhaii]